MAQNLGETLPSYLWRSFFLVKIKKKFEWFNFTKKSKPSLPGFKCIYFEEQMSLTASIKSSVLSFNYEMGSKKRYFQLMLLKYDKFNLLIIFRVIILQVKQKMTEF